MSDARKKAKYRATVERIIAVLADPETPVEIHNSLVDEVIEFCLNHHSIVKPEALRLIYPLFCEMEDDDPLAAIVAAYSTRGNKQPLSDVTGGDEPIM
jgi:hypothetical protein